MEKAKMAISEIQRAIDIYQWPHLYRSWSGPNNNTFTAWIVRHSPCLTVDLAPTAIGRDYLGSKRFISKAPSGARAQFSLWGILGINLPSVEGDELIFLVYQSVLAHFRGSPIYQALAIKYGQPSV